MHSISFAFVLAATLAAGVAVAQTAVPKPSEGFAAAQPTDVLSYNLIGLNATNEADETIGEIQDLILSQGHLTGYIVSVSGALGTGERYVIVRPDALKIIFSEADKRWHAVMNATKDQFKAAPEFKYEGRWKR